MVLSLLDPSLNKVPIALSLDPNHSKSTSLRFKAKSINDKLPKIHWQTKTHLKSSKWLTKEINDKTNPIKHKIYASKSTWINMKNKEQIATHQQWICNKI